MKSVLVFLFLSTLFAAYNTESFNIEVVLGPEPAELIVGYVRVSIPAGTFSHHEIHHISFSTDHHNNNHDNVTHHEVGYGKRSHSDNCPYDWMTWCQIGGNSSSMNWTIEPSPGARSVGGVSFLKPVKVHYQVSDHISSSGELWIAVDTEVPVTEGILPASTNNTEVIFEINSAGSYTVAKLPYVPPPNACQKCLNTMPSCLASLATTFSVGNVCNVSSSLLDVACLFPTFGSTSTCDLLCQKGEVENLVNPLLGVLCHHQDKSHAALANGLCHYYNKC